MNTPTHQPVAAPDLPLAAKEISWLSFNERVLQEAENRQVPVIERIRYLGIFSNNLDEFFRVRVADLRRLIAFSSGKEKDKNEQLYKKIQNNVVQLQKRFDRTYMDALEELRKNHIYLIDERQVQAHQHSFLVNLFQKTILPLLRPILFTDGQVRIPQLSDSSIYFAVKLVLENGQVRYSILEIPSPPLPRFVVIPSAGRSRKKVLIVIENIIRLCLKEVFRGVLAIQHAEAFTFKLTRDAELEIGEGVTQSLIDKVSSSLKKRKLADPVRFIYDAEMPEDLLAFLVKNLGFGRYDSLMAGSRYHNFKDFIQFPNLGSPALEFVQKVPIPVPELESNHLVFDTLRKRDVLLHYPYHSFVYVEDLLYTAALDPLVRSIKITLYRLARDSHIASALINAVHNRKEVTVIMELQARFDEHANIQWANQLSEAGINVIFGVPGLKVHSKLILIQRMEGSVLRYYTHIGTGNFNEKTARIYTDYSLLTYNQEIGQEVENLFEFIRYTYRQFKYRHLLVSPHTFRSGITARIEQEIQNAQQGRKSGITIKCNNLVDTQIIEKLYEASRAGVKIRLIVRGMMSLVPGVAGCSENIEAISIVDRYLEHGRVYIFENNGTPFYYIASADLMTRNLDFRVEVACPIYDPDLQSFLRDTIELQWQDNVKARILDASRSNTLRTESDSARRVRSQENTFALVRQYSGVATVAKKGSE
jgi:polyphosphate kinase